MSATGILCIVFGGLAALVLAGVLILALCKSAARGDRMNEAARGQEVEGE